MMQSRKNRLGLGLYGHPGPIITLLIAHGADVNVKATDGTTAWTYWRANPEIPEALHLAEAKK